MNYCPERIAYVATLSFLVTSCATPPDVKDVAGLDTYEIVRRVRCEMRDAIRSLAKNSIRDDYPNIYAGLNTDDDFLNFKYSDIRKDSVVNLYKNTVIGYDFSIDMTESKNSDASADVLHTFTRGTLGIGVGTTLNRESNGVESFRILDSFGRLATTISNNYCIENQKYRNGLYPVTGHLNLRSYAKKFLDLTQSGNLTGSNDGSDLAKYSIVMKFTTELKASIGSTLALPTRALTWELAGAEAKAEGIRKDTHQLTIVFVLPPSREEHAMTIAERRVEQELDYLRQRDDLRTFARR